MLPRVKIQFLNGQLGTVGESADGLLALIVGATAVSTTFVLEKPYSIRSVDDLTALGVTASNNAALVKVVEDFYHEAEEGTQVYIYGVATSEKVSDQFADNDLRDKLIAPLNGKLRGILLCNIGASETVSSSILPDDIYDALPFAQEFAEDITEDYKAPIFVGIEGIKFDASKDIEDLSTENYNRVFILIGDTTNTSHACMGTIAGRIASCAVQRNIGRVKDGSLFPTQMYIGAKTVEESESLIADLYDKGYITPRKYVGRSGYFFADDRMACKSTDDYAHLTARRVIDKAYRIAYDTLLDMLMDELEVNEDGTLQNAVAASWQQTVEDAINRQMTANGELSATDGEGCVCFIDPTQNVVSTSNIKVTLKVRPFGYARFVDVNLGFQVTTV